MSASNTKKTESTETKNPPPALKIRVGSITASLWENKDADGALRHNVTFERRFKDAEGNWKSTDSYGVRELLELAKTADLAHTKIIERQAADGG